ncbi:hypothetical protein [Streptomyces sp. NPDC050538]|uniref:hypothetical protein n=1 Tax=Streptomyces sp. NPDC050538 TaxID=3365627 RepID=UPI0037918993
MSAFDFDPADLDEEQLEALDGLSDEELAAYFEGRPEPEPDPLAGYSHAVPLRRFPDALERGITELPNL